MASSASAPDGGPAAPDGDDHPIDWKAAEQSPEFQELVAKKRAFIVPCTIFFFAWYFGFILLAGYAPDFMGSSVYEGLTVGYVLALTQFAMVWILGGLYLQRSARDFDPLSRVAAETAVEAGRRAALEARGEGEAPARPAPGGDGVERQAGARSAGTEEARP
jgi:uncharacterized membrane protein (DUF485 family)